METVKIEYWALHSHILTFFQNGGNFNEAIAKWKNHINAVNYFWQYFKFQKY